MTNNETNRIEFISTIVGHVLTFVAVILVLLQNMEIRDQNSMSNSALHGSVVTNQMQYNLQVMERTDDVLVQIADDPTCYDYVWGSSSVKPANNSKPIQCGDSLIDVLSMAQKAVNQLPGFSTNGNDWSSYISCVMEQSNNLRERVLMHPIWWPEVTPFARAAQNNPNIYTDQLNQTNPLENQQPTGC